MPPSKNQTPPPPDQRSRVEQLEQEVARLKAERDRTRKELEEQSALTDASFEAIGFFDSRDLHCVACNNTALKIYGYTREEFLGKHVLDLVAPDSRGLVSQKIKHNVQTAYELTAIRKDGATFPAEVHGKQIIYQGVPVRVSALRDITRRKNIELELQHALNEQEVIFANTKVGLMLLRGGRVVAKVNQALADLFGYDTPEEMIGLDVRDLHLDEARYHTFGKEFYGALEDAAQLHIEYQLRRKDGSPVWCRLSGQAVDLNAPADLKKGVLWVIDDISRIKDEEQRLRALACTDYLTGVHNRRYFLELAEREMRRRRRHGGQCALLLIDMDRFKDVNDRLGHPAGDAVLKTFARRCCGTLREVDIFGRLGGEEFAVFLPGTDLEGGRVAAERIRHRVSSLDTRTPEGNICATVSIGVASTDHPTAGVEDLISRADKALYRAKALGRDRVETE